MLIGVELPITEENVKNIDFYNLIKAYEMFLLNALEDERKGSIFSRNLEQYNICKNEVFRRLQSLEEDA